MIPWARASDKYGRKPCLLVALYCSALSTAMFGFSTSFPQMLFWRGVNGAFSGSVVIVRTLFAELTDQSNQARAFSFYAFSGNLALLVGPVIGGYFSEPAKRLPSLFGKLTLFKEVSLSLVDSALYSERSRVPSFSDSILSLCPASSLALSWRLQLHSASFTWMRCACTRSLTDMQSHADTSTLQHLNSRLTERQQTRRRVSGII